MPKFTIITVTYNAKDIIEETIGSVLEQTYRDFEYLIVDGGSTDGTVDIISKYDDRVRYISEPDKGIYDAMNKGVRMAKGDYVNFLNAGDRFHDEKVLEDIARETERGGVRPAPQIIYGNIVYLRPDGSESIRTYSQFCSSLFYYLLGDCINHQAMFALRQCFEKGDFDLSYRISADREWMIRQKKAGMTFKAIDRLIVYYSLDDKSMSIANEDLTWKENDLIIKKHLPLGFPLYHFLNMIRHGSVSSKILHKLYELVFIRKSR